MTKKINHNRSHRSFLDKELTEKEKRLIEQGVDKVIREYGEVLKKLGQT